ncbi:MAG: prepilin-type N-terminal cleavage/methylation domain-containing protein [Candidatus Manganitrophaceae bacterium]
MFNLIPRTDVRGFTLIEIILAVLVISIAVVGMTSAISFVGQGSLDAEATSTAKELAQEKLEQIMGDKRDMARGYAYVITPGQYPAEPAVAGFTNYSRSVTVTEVNPSDLSIPSANSGFARVGVDVSYAGLPGVPTPAASLVTVVTNVRE